MVPLVLAVGGATGGRHRLGVYCYAQLPRTQHPTLSALIDMLDSSRLGKIVAVAVWLGLGFFLVTA